MSTRATTVAPGPWPETTGNRQRGHTLYGGPSTTSSAKATTLLS